MSWTTLLLAAERAVDIGAEILRRGCSHIGALIAKGDRDFATSVDVEIESSIKAELASAAPSIPFLGEEGGGDDTAEALWVLDPIDGTINFARDSPLCTISLSLSSTDSPCSESSTRRCSRSASPRSAKAGRT